MRGMEMPRLARIDLPEPEREAATRVQRQLDELVRQARTFTAAAEMLSFAQQRAGTHEAQHQGDSSALGIERKNLLAEWQSIAVREGAMTLIHFAEAMHDIIAGLDACPTIAAALDKSRLEAISGRFGRSFPGFAPLAKAGGAGAARPPSGQPSAGYGFSRSYSAHVRIHGEKDTIFRIGDSRKYIARAAGGEELVSYQLDSGSVFELREITAAFAEAFAEAADRLAPRWAPQKG